MTLKSGMIMLKKHPKMYYPEKQKNTSGILTGNQIQPLITWGKVNENYEMSVAITVSHIFVNGSELGLFYKKVQENFNQPI